jgi:hypothetical protein
MNIHPAERASLSQSTMSAVTVGGVALQRACHDEILPTKVEA